MNAMDLPIDDLPPPLPGFRLAKLEVYNWGTFDGAVYSVQPRGQTTLLIGENGSGKSTLVDAMLTLLVRPQTRNYNVAAGATKNERDERTYIRGAYDRTLGEGGRPQVQYLRSGRNQYTVILACFENAGSGKSFTVCQVLYLDAENAVEKVYAFADSERGIVKDLGDLSSSAGIARQLRDRGFKTTSSYKEYFGWLQKATGFRPKAMDIFNQTVAVKDVQRLDLFIRQHMLERKPWNERVGQLLRHFNELSESHRMLVRIRQQDELLRPVVAEGKRYEERSAEVVQARRRLDATQLYFAQEQTRLLEPLCAKWQEQIDYLASEIKRLDGHQDKLRRNIAHLEVEIENSGGDRLKALPALIAQAEELAKLKASRRATFEAQLKLAGIDMQITSPDQFPKVRAAVTERRRVVAEERLAVQQKYDSLQYQIGTLTTQLSHDRAEAEALERRKGNLPESFISLRERMCRDLKLAPSDLPFAAELMSVPPEHREWEASIEHVLHGFARSLLVSSEVYSRVAGYVDRTRLVDAHGHGQRLVYLRVGTRSDATSTVDKQRGECLAEKLEYREHQLTPWVRAEIDHKFNYLACDTVEQFQRASGAAMTRNRHFKSGHTRHEKNDRNANDDRRHFVLGWDNRAKRMALVEAINQATRDLEDLQLRADRAQSENTRLIAALAALDQTVLVDDFDAIDNGRHEFEASQLRVERQQLEQSDDKILELKSMVAKLRNEADGYKADRDAHIANRTTREGELKQGQRWLSAAQDRLKVAASDGRLAVAEVEFESLRALVGQELTLDNVAVLPETFERQQRHLFDRLQDSLVPVARELTSAMTRFLKKFPDEHADLDAHVASLSSFVALHQRIAGDDLPQHEERFKKRLNEKVLHEIGLLHGGLESERQEIRNKIEQLNVALKLLQWKPGTYMQLEPSDVQDREILDFRRDLAGCLSGTFDGTPEANEATFVRIEKLVEKLRDENNSRWRDKVVDVRNWFSFAARELVAETGEVRSFYDGGTGQSGGEKGKLAFLVLVAAIAYQYDLEPDADSSDRFHFVMVDEMFSRSDDQHAEYALELFERFRLQLLIVAPLDAKARVTEPYVGTYLHVVKNKQTHRSELLSITAEELHASVEQR